MENGKKRVFKKREGILSRKEKYYSLDSVAILKFFSFLSVFLSLVALILYFLMRFSSNVSSISIIFSILMACFTLAVVRPLHSIDLSEEDDYIFIKAPLWFWLPEISLILSMSLSLYRVLIN